MASLRPIASSDMMAVSPLRTRERKRSGTVVSASVPWILSSSAMLRGGGGTGGAFERGEADRILGGRLHAIHRGVGLADQIVLAQRVRRERRDSQAGGDGDLHVRVQMERRRCQ